MKQYMLPHQAKQLALKLCSSPVYRFYVQFACNIRLYNLDVLRLSVAVFSQIGHFTKMQYMLSLPSHLFLCKPQIFYESSKYNFAIFIGPESDHCLPLSLTHWLTNSLLFSKLDWCNPGVRRCQLKTCWCCNYCWWWSCWQQFVADLDAEVWSKS